MRLASAGLPFLFILMGFSGCIWLDGHCGPHYEDATWREPGLFAALSHIPAETPDTGFTFYHPEAEERWGPHYVASHVSYSAGHGMRERMDLSVSLSPSSTGDASHRGNARSDSTTLYMQGPADLADAEWRAFLGSFLDVTEVVVEDREAWIDGLLSDRTIFAESYDPQTGDTQILLGTSRPVQQEPDLDALTAKLGTADDGSDASLTQQTWFRWTTDNATWEVDIRLATRTIQIESTTEGQTEEVSVDAADRVTATLQQDVGGHEALVQDWLRERFEARGLPEPTFQDFQIPMSIC